ncbi:hypothetical protein TorRG33x02_042470 [Trema orientale]|uniref:Uncharacterized protein n=1 Tax=Trema orientale TaxID=63057 RepID=A0A2P5FPV0_TREOI|nr:hypothetical protein TorRG33x02_042470 [Trema orientale]
MYGVPNANADVLEDESQSCLWCWEVSSYNMWEKEQKRLQEEEENDEKGRVREELEIKKQLRKHRKINDVERRKKLN